MNMAEYNFDVEHVPKIRFGLSIIIFEKKWVKMALIELFRVPTRPNDDNELDEYGRAAAGISEQALAIGE